MSVRRLIVPWFVALVVGGLVALPEMGSTGARDEIFRLGAGDAVFWNGPYIEAGSDSWSYKLRVTEPGYRLRVGVDHPEVGDDFTIRLVSPNGTAVSSGTGTGLYSAEVMVTPKVGTYRVEVQANSVDDSRFRVRAKLEARKPGYGVRRGAVPPNLQILPPHEANFLVPITNGSQGDPPQGQEGPDSCHPEEHAEGAVRCLRFAFGIRNTGRGPLQLYFEGPTPADHPLIQRVQRADGSHFDREAGTAVYHESHAHYHHSEAVALQLFAVTDREAGTMTSASGRQTKGFAHRSELLRDWHHFYPTWSNFGFGLRAGWSDIYEWDRPGNYIDFGVNGDGYYVVRMWADPVDGILESNEKDNLGYTYLQVTGTDVELIEAGRGKHPWDPCKIMVGFGGHPDPKNGPRPAHCPPDTT